MCRFLLYVLLAGQTVPQPSPARAAWTLDDVVTAALAQHPLVEAARARVIAVEGTRRTATAFPNPIATYWLEHPEISVYATLPLEPFLQRRSRMTAAGSDVRAAQAAVLDAERQIALDAAHAFYRLAFAQASIDAVRDNRAAIEPLVVYLRARVAQGASPEGELIRAEVERDRADTEVTLAGVELLRAQAALRPWLGGADVPLAALRAVNPDAPNLTAPLAPFAEFAAHALAQRPELLAGRARVESAAGAIAVEHSLVMRQVGATFGVKRTNATNALIAGVSLTVPLFDRNRGEIQRATGARLAADQELRWLERDITAEVDGAYQAAVRLAQVTSLQPAFISRAEESRRIALGAYQEGAASLLQVLDASRALTDVRLTSARALVAASAAFIELGLAAGYDVKTAARLGRSPSPVANAMKQDGGSR